jgi:hypothetical protein
MILESFYKILRGIRIVEGCQEINESKIKKNIHQFTAYNLMIYSFWEIVHFMRGGHLIDKFYYWVELF